MMKWKSELADSVHDFGLGMERPVPAQRRGLAKWKARIRDCVQDFKGSSFHGMELLHNTGECAERIIKTGFCRLAGFKRT